MGRVHRPWFAQWSEAVGASVQSGSAEETPPSATATPPDAGAVIAAGPRLRVGQPFDPKAAVLPLIKSPRRMSRGGQSVPQPRVPRVP